MKLIRNLLSGLLIISGLIGLLNLLHAQDTTTSSQDGTITDTNIDWNSLSDFDVELKAVEAMPTVSASQFEASGLEGTFYSAQHISDWPPVPGDWLSLPIWEVDTNLFLINDLAINYNALQKAAAKPNGLHALDDGGGGFSPDFSIPTNGLFLQITGVSNGYANLILNGTTNGVEYEILSQPALGDGTNIADWNSEGLFWGSSATNWTATTVAQNNRTNLFFSARSWQDSTGTGIPNWWWIMFFNQDTNVDAYADPDGDGWNNLQEFQNGTSPTAFDTPPAPQGLTADYDSDGGTATVSWLPSPGAVTGYTVEKDDNYAGTVQDLNFSAATSSFEDNVSTDEDDLFSGDTLNVTYKIEAQYAGGDSAWGGPVPLEQNTLVANFIAGPQGSAYLAVPSIPTGTVTLQVTRYDDTAYGNDQFFGDTTPYLTNFDISVADSTNGLYLIPSSWCVMQPDVYGNVVYDWSVQTLNTNGAPNATSSAYQGYNFPLEDGRGWLAPPYFDGRGQLKQNLAFLLRAAVTDSSFAYASVNTNTDYAFNFSNPDGYVYAGFYQLDEKANDQVHYENIGSFDVYWPFENNYRYRNFVFNSAEINANGFINTGAGSYGVCDFYNDGANTFYFDEIYGTRLVVPDGLTLQTPPTYLFQSSLNNGENIPSLLGADQTQWLASYALDSTPDYLEKIGITTNGAGTYFMADNAKNIYGLSFLSATIAYNAGGSAGTTTLSAGGHTTQSGNFYPETAQPQFQTAEYDFWNPNLETLPGSAGFSTTNTSGLLITGVGNPNFQVAGYARLAVLNGNSGLYGYLGQYFDQAYQIDTNGTVTTNTTGVLSSYGTFFATQPGPAALVTMPDLDTGERGTGIVYAVSLQLDANHDGNMDTAFSGPDNTSAANPMEAWVNNGLTIPGTDGNLDYDAEVFPNTPPNYATNQITCPRELENFFRLWICGMPSIDATEGYQVTLSWANVSSGNPAIKLFPTYEADGGIGYLTNSTIAQNTVGYPAYGEVSPGTNFVFPDLFFDNTGTKHFLFEGSGIGSGELVMTISQNGNTIAQTGVWLDLHDIKDFYERAVIAENTSGAISNWSSTIETVQPAIANLCGNDTNQIVFVHGINVDDWHWLDDSDTILKRLYWAGYNGKFMTVRWPCNLINFTTFLTLDKNVFNQSELYAYKAGTALADYLSQLRIRFPNDHLNLFVHSQGNAVVSEAIEEGAPFDNYIMTQGAMPDSCYDLNAPSNSVLLTAENSYATPDWQPMGYHGVYTNLNLTGRIVNFYNADDPVLAYWVTDQKDIKPSGGYIYDGTNGWQIGQLPTYMVTDPQESRSMIARSRTLSIGQSGPASGHGVIQSAVDLNAQFGFGDTFPADHSAQWTWPIQTSYLYYKQILTQIQPAP